MALKQIFVINSDLKMSAGKIGVQTAHAATFYTEMIKDLEHEKNQDYTQISQVKGYNNWRYDDDNCMRKIVKKATEAEMTNLIAKMAHLGIWVCQVHDRGITQVAPNSFTCLVIEPLPTELCDELFGHLKLL